MSKQAAVLRMSQVPTYRALSSESNATNIANFCFGMTASLPWYKLSIYFCEKERISFNLHKMSWVNKQTSWQKFYFISF